MKKGWLVLSREIKEYAVRRNEILDTAQSFFLEKGYEKTSVKELIEQIGIAKGTFYYYFAAKEELLTGLIERVVEEAREIYQEILEKDMGALDKLNLLFNEMAIWRTESPNLVLLRNLTGYQDVNLKLWTGLKEKTLQRLGPILYNLVEEGKAEGVFSTLNSKDMSEMILILIFDLKESIARIIRGHKGIKGKSGIKKMIFSRIEGYEFVMEKILGVTDGSIIILER